MIKLLSFTLFLFLFLFCKPNIDKTNYPLLFTLINSKDAFNAITYPQSSYLFPTNTQIFLVPTSNFPVTSCTVTPALPVGLSLDPDCFIFGVTSGIQSPVIYSITANTASPTAKTNIEIAIVPLLMYVEGGPYFDITVGQNFILTPGGSGISTCSAIGLPAGLTIDNTCRVTGTANAAAAFTVTGYNSSGGIAALTTIYLSIIPP